jgi:hypothetical protein
MSRWWMRLFVQNALTHRTWHGATIARCTLVAVVGTGACRSSADRTGRSDEAAPPDASPSDSGDRSSAAPAPEGGYLLYVAADATVTGDPITDADAMPRVYCSSNSDASTADARADDDCMPPRSICKDTSTLLYYGDGQCVDGQCVFQAYTLDCRGGYCENGGCLGSFTLL